MKVVYFMASHEKKIAFNASKKDVFTRFTNAVLLDFNQKSTTFNTSYAQPVGTEFQYNEHNFGQTVQYTVKITEHDKPNLFAYTLASKNSNINIVCRFEEKGEHTVLIYSIILENDNFFQRLKKASLLKELDGKIRTYADYTRKILK